MDYSHRHALPDEWGKVSKTTEVHPSTEHQAASQATPATSVISERNLSIVSKSLTTDEDYFERRELRLVCTQKLPWDDFLPQASEIIQGRLYLCDVYTATSPLVLKRLDISHVISVMRAPWYRYPTSIQHLCIPVDDTQCTNISAYFDCATEWIHNALKRSPDNRVLVHCVWGMSRSASFVLAYLIGRQGMTLDGALAYVKSRRNVVNPNRGFLSQLIQYERRKRQNELL